MKLPSLLFLVALAIDHYFTQSGLAQGYSEGNIVVIWLWSVVPGGPHVLAALWAVTVILVCTVLYKFSHDIARWALYTAFTGHLIGLLSWTVVLRGSVANIFDALGHEWGLLLLTFCAAGAGALLAFVHDHLETVALL